MLKGLENLDDQVRLRYELDAVCELFGLAALCTLPLGTQVGGCVHYSFFAEPSRRRIKPERTHQARHEPNNIKKWHSPGKAICNQGRLYLIQNYSLRYLNPRFKQILVDQLTVRKQAFDRSNPSSSTTPSSWNAARLRPVPDLGSLP